MHAPRRRGAGERRTALPAANGAGSLKGARRRLASLPWPFEDVLRCRYRAYLAKLARRFRRVILLSLSMVLFSFLLVVFIFPWSCLLFRVALFTFSGGHV